MTGINPQLSNSKQKRLLILTDWFWPGYKAGGPIQSCINLCKALNKIFDIYVLTTDTDHATTEPYSGIKSGKWIFNDEMQVHVCYLSKKEVSVTKIRQHIKDCNADTIYLNHLFSPLFVVYPIWLFITNKINGKMVVCPRGALYDSALAVKKYKKAPLLIVYKLLGIHKRIVFHATNKREEEAIQKYFPGSSIVIADNLPDTNESPFTDIVKNENELKCVFISRIVPIKNLSFLLSLLKDIQQPLQLTIAGPAEDQSYFDECVELIKELPGNITVNHIGPVANSQIRSLIQQHHLFILPTKGENFGHSIIEALIAGRPVLISDQTPWNNVEKAGAGWTLPLDKPSAYVNCIQHLLSCNKEQYSQYAKAAWNFAREYVVKNDAVIKYQELFS